MYCRLYNYCSDSITVQRYNIISATSLCIELLFILLAGTVGRLPWQSSSPGDDSRGAALPLQSS